MHSKGMQLMLAWLGLPWAAMRLPAARTCCLVAGLHAYMYAGLDTWRVQGLTSSLPVTQASLDADARVARHTCCHLVFQALMLESKPAREQIFGSRLP
jgi:hypothetical protein